MRFSGSAWPVFILSDSLELLHVTIQYLRLVCMHAGDQRCIYFSSEGMTNIYVIHFITRMGFRWSFSFRLLVSPHISITTVQQKFQGALMQSNPSGHKHPSDMRAITNSLNPAESERCRPGVDPALPLTPWHNGDSHRDAVNPPVPSLSTRVNVTDLSWLRSGCVVY